MDQESSQAPRELDLCELEEVAGGVSKEQGAMTGAAIGAAVGSLGGPVGAVGGAIVGAIVGSALADLF